MTFGGGSVVRKINHITSLYVSKEKKMSSKAQVSGGGIGLGTVLFLIFLVLKLTGVIGWSWWWVTAPLWCPIAVFVVLAIAALLIALVVGSCLDHLKRRK